MRFAFGRNWRGFLDVVDERRIESAVKSLRNLVGPLAGKTFLDVGCGSGLSSLAALRLGAVRVHSFDYDADCVTCTQELKRRFAPDANWTVERGDVLDAEYLRSLGSFDVVYSWGVLHHTGDMWRALDQVRIPLAENGTVAVSLYNDQGRMSKVWRLIKRTYNGLPRILRPVYAFALLCVRDAAVLLRRGPACYVRRWSEYQKGRGMSRWHDHVDWIGGYPFEVATPGAVSAFFQQRGFVLSYLDAPLGIACNQFVFRRV